MDPASLDDFGNDLLSNPLLWMGQGMLQASGPSSYPTSLGQVAGAGMLSGMQGRGAYLDQATKALMLNRQKMIYQALSRGFGAGGAPAPSAPEPDAASVSPPPLAPPPGPGAAGANAGSALAPSPAPAGILSGNASPAQPTAGPLAGGDQGGFSPDDLANLAMLNGDYAGAGNMLLNQKRDQWRQMSPDEVKQYYGNETVPGFTYLVNGLGDVKPVGEGTIKDVTSYDPRYGITTKQLYDIATKKAVTGEFGLDPNAAPPSGDDPMAMVPANYRSSIQKWANYEGDVPRAVKSNPILFGNVQNAMLAVNPGYDEKNYPAASAALTSFTSGDYSKQINAADTVLRQTAAVKQLIPALGNTSSPAYNTLAEAFKKQTGDAAPTNLAEAKSLLQSSVDEMMGRAGLSPEQKKAADDAITSASSPQALLGAVQQVERAAGGKLSEFKRAYGASGLQNFESRMKLSPAAARALAEAEASGGGGGAPTPPAGGTIPKAPKDMTDAELLQALGSGGG